jgi:hypothetical protein
MSTGALDPLIHDPEQLRIVATLAALPDGDALSVTRLQDMIGLTPVIAARAGFIPLSGGFMPVRAGQPGTDRASRYSLLRFVIMSTVPGSLKIVSGWPLLDRPS